MNAFQLLKEDHQKVSGIFQQLEPTTERAEKTRTELFAKLKQELDIHAKIEETILYPAIKQAAETREIVLEGFEEHHVVKLLLKELESLPVDTEQWTAKLKVLQENVEHHVEEEEGEMFQKARQVLSEDDINRLGAEMEEMKKQLQSQTGVQEWTVERPERAESGPPNRWRGRSRAAAGARTTAPREHAPTALRPATTAAPP